MYSHVGAARFGGEAGNNAQGERMIRTVWPTLTSMLLAAGILPAPGGRYGWRFFSKRFRSPGARRLHRSGSPFATGHSPSLAPSGILAALAGYILDIGFYLPAPTVLPTLASV